MAENSKCRVIAISNQKGGVAKTTTTYTLGAGLVREGYQVLMIDSDPQFSLTSALGVNADYADNTFTEAVMSTIFDDNYDIHKSIWSHEEGMDFIPSNSRSAKLIDYLYAARSREMVLRDVVEQVKDDYDFVLIDCPPSLDLLMLNDLVAADEVIIPCQPETFSSVGITLLLNTIKSVTTKRLNPSLKIDGVLLTMVRDVNLHKRHINLVRETLDGLVKIYDMEIKQTVKVGEAIEKGISIFKNSPKEEIASQYMDFVKAVINEENDRRNNPIVFASEDKITNSNGYYYDSGR